MNDVQRVTACHYDTSNRQDRIRYCREFNPAKKVNVNGVCIFVDDGAQPTKPASMNLLKGWYYGHWRSPPSKTQHARFTAVSPCLGGVDVASRIDASKGNNFRIGPTQTMSRIKTANPKYYVNNDDASKQQACADCRYAKSSGVTQTTTPLTEPAICYKTEAAGVPASPKECQVSDPNAIGYCSKRVLPGTVAPYINTHHGQWWTITTNAKGTRWVPCNGGVDLIVAADKPKRVMAIAGVYKIAPANSDDINENQPLNCFYRKTPTSALISKPCQQGRCINGKGAATTPPIGPYTQVIEDSPPDGTASACENLETTCVTDTDEMPLPRYYREFKMVGKTKCRCYIWYSKVVTNSNCCWDTGNATWGIFKNTKVSYTCEQLQIEEVNGLIGNTMGVVGVEVPNP